jgi:hypothetical protein
VQAHEPVSVPLDTSNGTWNTTKMLASAALTQLWFGTVASIQSLFGVDNSAAVDEMNKAGTVLHTVGFDINAGGVLNQVGAVAGKVTTSVLVGATQIAMNVVGYTARVAAGIVESIWPGVITPQPAPTPFLEMVDDGATLGEQIGYVGSAFLQSLYSGGAAFFKMSADLAAGNWESAKENGVEALTMLLGMKVGETALLWKQLKLRVRQMAFDVQQLAQGVISQSPLEFLTKGPEGRQLIIKREQELDPIDPTAPPIEVTKISTSEQFEQQVTGDLLLNRDDTVAYKGTFCFAAGTLVHTKEGLKPIEQIKVGDWVLSKHESGEGEQAYKRVTRTIKSNEDVPICLVRYYSEPDHKFEDLFVTPNHPFYVKVYGKDVGWQAAAGVTHPLELVAYDNTSISAYDCYTLWCTPDEGISIGLGTKFDTGPVIDFRDGVGKIIDEYGDERVMGGMSALWCQTVYNIEVEDYHTYYVGEFGVWVHNTNCGGAGDAGITQPVSLQPLRPVGQVYSRTTSSGLPHPSELKGPGVILEEARIDLASSLEEAYVFEGNLPGAFEGNRVRLDTGGLGISTPQWSAVFRNSKGWNTIKFDGRVPTSDLTQWTNTFLDSKTSLPIIKKSDVFSDFRRRAEAMNQIDGQLIITIKKTVKGEDNFKAFVELRNFISQDVAKQDFWLKEKQYEHLALHFEGDAYVVVFDKDGNWTLQKPKFTATQIVNGKPETVEVDGLLEKPPLHLLAESEGASRSSLALMDANSLLPAAKQYWLNAGAPEALLDSVEVTVDTLAPGIAAMTLGKQITLSADGAGWGWFVDATPAEQEEFGPGDAPNEFKALAGSAAEGQLDLLTVLIHELGHVLGLGHAPGDDDVMVQYLTPGVRRLPVAEDLAALASQQSYDTSIGQWTTVGATLVPDAPVQTPSRLAQAQQVGAWSTRGSVAFDDIFTRLTLNESATTQTNAGQIFTLTEHDRILSFTLDGLALDDQAAGPDDAFEVGLLDAHSGALLTGAIGLSRSDALLNFQANGVERTAAGVIRRDNDDGSRTYRVDLHNVPAGTAAHLSFDLIGFAGTGSQVTVRDLRLSSDPVAFADVATLDEDTLATGNVLANDLPADVPGVQAQLVEGPGHGVLTLAEDGGFTYRPDADYFGADGFSYRSVDAEGRVSNTARVEFTIDPVNDAPVLPPPSATTVTAGQPYTFDPLAGAFDVDGPGLTVHWVTPPQHGTLTANSDGSLYLDSAFHKRQTPRLILGPGVGHDVSALGREARNVDGHPTPFSRPQVRTVA